MNADFAKALIKAQQEMPAVAKMARAQYGQYMDLDHLLAGMLPVLNRNQIMLAQFPTQNDQGFPSLTTVLVHESGDSLSFEMPLVMDEAAKMNRTQAQGSAITYARRYAAAAALGISSEKDDDANAASAGGVNAPASSQPSSPKPPLATAVGAAPPAEDNPSPEDLRRRMAEKWDKYNVHEAIEAVGKIPSVDVLESVRDLEMGREERGKGKPRKMVDHAIRDRIASLEGEPPAADAPGKTGQAAVAQADGPPPADDGVRAAAGQSFEPASPSENNHPDGVTAEVTAEKVKAALAFIQDQPSTVENAHAWTVSGVLLGLSQHGVAASTLEEVDGESLTMVWGAIPDDVRAMIGMYGPETLTAEAAKAK